MVCCWLSRASVVELSGSGALGEAAIGGREQKCGAHDSTCGALCDTRYPHHLEHRCHSSERIAGEGRVQSNDEGEVLQYDQRAGCEKCLRSEVRTDSPPLRDSAFACDWLRISQWNNRRIELRDASPGFGIRSRHADAQLELDLLSSFKIRSGMFIIDTANKIATSHDALSSYGSL